MEPASPASNLAFLLHHLAFNLDHQSDQILQEQLGVGFAQFKILLALQVNPIVGQRELANSLSQTEASVSRQMKLLRTKGMVISRINPKNRREHHTLITSKGQRVREAAIALLEKQYQRSFDVLDVKIQARLTQDLTSLSEKLSIDSKHESYRHLWENMI
jgi:DNA-binding MarR family transcriptional regulator